MRFLIFILVFLFACHGPLPHYEDPIPTPSDSYSGDSDNTLEPFIYRGVTLKLNGIYPAAQMMAAIDTAVIAFRDGDEWLENLTIYVCNHCAEEPSITGYFYIPELLITFNPTAECLGHTALPHVFLHAYFFQTIGWSDPAHTLTAYWRPRCEESVCYPGFVQRLESVMSEDCEVL